ncbi:hypothetical protein DM01DRAFT_1238707 [Hesseltinella vesiculosa]|uniref:Uncharacterized protein n=1 Tax=Hesseltinella vesiculosa TaxID=101127 RepID=A0A1X2GLW7_9FUNG|nr:hypothetical protein DM01DRAFT_1238707 [Hesseltinella vesiculosa]
MHLGLTLFLAEKSNIRFMQLLQGKDVAEEIDVFYTPAYAAGEVVVDSLISNVLLSQTYYKPDIVSIIKALCGMPGPLFQCEAHAEDISTLSTSCMHAPHLTSIPCPMPLSAQPLLSSLTPSCSTTASLPLASSELPMKTWATSSPLSTSTLFLPWSCVPLITSMSWLRGDVVFFFFLYSLAA